MPQQSILGGVVKSDLQAAMTGEANQDRFGYKHCSTLILHSMVWGDWVMRVN